MNIDWDGNGLPPVGITCERRFIDHNPINWARMEVIAHGKQTIYYRDRNGTEWSHYINDLEFRPVESKKQKANWQREKEIRAMGLIVLSQEKFSVMDGVTALYDAGYRKFEIVEEDV